MIPWEPPFLHSNLKIKRLRHLSKFIFVPKNTTKVNTSFAGKDELRMVKEAQTSKDFMGGALVGKTAFGPPIVGNNSIAGGPFPSSIIHEFDKNDDAFDPEKT